MKYDMSSLISHSGDMIFIDEVKEFSDTFIRVGSKIKPTNPLLQDGKLPHFVYLEIMAQCISALAGIKAKQNSEKLALNLLLGCRNFDILKPSVDVGSELKIQAKSSLESEEGFGIYECFLYENDTMIAKGNLNVYSPAQKENL